MRSFLFALLLTLASPLLAQDKVRIQLNWIPEPEFGGIYAAQVDGTFAKNNLSVDIIPAAPGNPVWQQIDQGRSEFGVVSADEVLLANSKGADLVAIFTIYQTCPQAIMAHESRGFKTLADVLQSPGTLALEPGLPYAQFLRKKYPFKVSTVAYTGGITTFLADKNFAQQCFVFSEPVSAKHKGANPQVFLIAESGYNPYTGVIVTTNKFLNANKPICESMVASLKSGWRSYLDDPKSANKLMADLNKNMDERTFADAAEAQKLLIESPETKTSGLGAMTADRWQTLHDQLTDLKILKRPTNPTKAFINLGK